MSVYRRDRYSFPNENEQKPVESISIYTSVQFSFILEIILSNGSNAR